MPLHEWGDFLKKLGGNQRANLPMILVHVLSSSRRGDEQKARAQHNGYHPTHDVVLSRSDATSVDRGRVGVYQNLKHLIRPNFSIKNQHFY